MKTTEMGSVTSFYEPNRNWLQKLQTESYQTDVILQKTQTEPSRIENFSDRVEPNRSSLWNYADRTESSRLIIFS